MYCASTLLGGRQDRAPLPIVFFRWGNNHSHSNSLGVWTLLVVFKVTNKTSDFSWYLRDSFYKYSQGYPPVLVSSRLLSRTSLVSFFFLLVLVICSTVGRSCLLCHFYIPLCHKATYEEVVVEQENPCLRGVGFIRTVLKRWSRCLPTSYTLYNLFLGR